MATFGKYRLEERIGFGAMGIVLRAFDTERERWVALKVLPGGFTGDSEYRARFEREARLVMKLEHHPNIVPVYDFGEIDGQLYIEMALLQGEDLEVKLRRVGALELSEAVRIVEAVASALDAAHGNNLIHRDIKPSNIFILGSGHIYVIDFGIAFVDGETYTASGAGTAAYQAPERYRNESTPQVDVYSLACVLYQMLTGRLPYAGGVHEQMLAHLSDPPPRPSEEVLSLPKSIDAVIAKGMNKKPSSRFSSAGGLAAAARGSVSSTVGGDPEPTQRERPTGSRRAVMIGAGILASVLVAIASYVVWPTSTAPAARYDSAFNGSYDVEIQQTSFNDEPVKPGPVYKYIWSVRSHCRSDTSCTASITVSNDDGSVQGSRTADLVEGAWLQTTRTPSANTTCGGTNYEQTIWSTMTINEDGNGRFTGTQTDYADKPCNQKTVYRIALTRAGDVDPTVLIAPPDEVTPYVVKTPGASFQGRYDLVYTPLTETGQDVAENIERYMLIVRSMCLRDGTACASVAKWDDGSAVVGEIWEYTAGIWNNGSAGVMRSCPAESQTQATYIRQRPLKRIEGDIGVAVKLAGTWNSTYSDPCPQAFRGRAELARIGD